MQAEFYIYSSSNNLIVFLQTDSACLFYIIGTSLIIVPNASTALICLIIITSFICRLSKLEIFHTELLVISDKAFNQIGHFPLVDSLHQKTASLNSPRVAVIFPRKVRINVLTFSNQAKNLYEVTKIIKGILDLSI